MDSFISGERTASPYPLKAATGELAMRGGDGLSRAAMYSFYTEGNTVTIPYFHTCKAELELESGTLKLHEQANDPASGKMIFHCLGGTDLSVNFFGSTDTGNGPPPFRKPAGRQPYFITLNRLL